MFSNRDDVISRVTLVRESVSERFYKSKENIKSVEFVLKVATAQIESFTITFFFISTFPSKKKKGTQERCDDPFLDII